MPKLLPPEYPKLYSRFNFYLLIGILWLTSLAVILLVSVVWLLSGWGLILSIVSSSTLALIMVRGFSVWRENQLNKKLEEYEQDYRLFARQRKS